jgi:hypothetical protein
MEFDLSEVGKSWNDIKRGLILPNEPSEELAEFFGILTGDGYINYYPNDYKSSLEIAGDSRFDEMYLKNHVAKLVKILFNLESSYSIKKGQNSIYLRLISKGLINYLSTIGFKKGRKGQIGIPEWILHDKTHMTFFLKGMIDTDGSIHFRGDYPIISISSKSEVLIKHLFNFIQKEGFKLKNYYKEERIEKRGYNNSVVYKVRLNGHENLNLWLKLVGFRNERHLNKLKSSK